MTRNITILILIFLAWCFVSYRWYVCGIKELCTDSSVTATQLVEKTVEESAQPVTEKFVSEYRNAEVISNSATDLFLDSLTGLMNVSDTLSIVGLYRGGESKQVGQNRAEAVTDLVELRGFDLPVTVATRFVGNDTSSLVHKAVEFVVISSPKVSEFAFAEVGDKIIVNFPSASTDPSMNNLLNERLKTLSNEVVKNKLKLSISGHTDNTGTPEANQYYGMQRAKAIASILEVDGVRDDQMKVVSKGEKEPLETNNSAEGRARNRRVEIVIIRN